ncbi:ATP-binding cassette domain-containing protein [Arcobacteraceae bacterium]|nr:ATP-binding cassette domain-containing protein [Arcobacteraceae bacterium]
MKTEEIVFEIRELEKTYHISKGLFKKPNKIKAVNKTNFEVKHGETFSIVGESGCGKSTTAKMLLNIEHPTSGQIFFRGRDISTFTKEEWSDYRKKVQIIFQDPYSSLNPRWTVGKIISEPLELNSKLSKKEIEIEVYKIMSKVGLDESWYNRYPHQFSGGQRQRIGIARALILKPEVIVCDEPVSALDVSIQAQVLNLLLDLQDEFDLTYIFISHDLGVVEHISDRIMVMYFGDVVELATVEDLFQNPQDDYTKKLLNAIPSIAAFENNTPSNPKIGGH